MATLTVPTPSLLLVLVHILCPSVGLNINSLPKLVTRSANKIFMVYFWNSVAWIACYGLEVPGFESHWGPDIPYPFTPASRPIQSRVQWVPGILPEDKVVGACT